MSAASASSTASQAAAVNQPTREPRPLDHLTRAGSARAGADGANLTSFEAALRSASGRATPNIDTGGSSLPLFKAAPTRTEPTTPNRPAPRAERPGADRSTRPAKPTTPEPRRDDRAGDATQARGDGKVDNDRRAPDRTDDGGDTSGARVDNGRADGPEADDTSAGDGAEETTETEQSTDVGDDAAAATAAAEVAVQLIAPQLVAEQVAVDTTVDTEQVATATEATTTVAAATDVDVDLDAGAGTEQRVDVVDDTTDSGPVVVVDDNGPARGGGDAETEQSGDGADRGHRDGPSLRHDDGPDLLTPAATGQADRAADQGRHQQLVVTAEATTTRTTTTESSSGTNGTALTGLDRVGGPSRTTGRAEAAAPADATPADASADADGPDAVWRQVRRALGNLRTRADGEREMVVRLRPEQLGSVTVRVHTTEAGVRVSLIADTAAAAGQLDQQRHQLLGELDESGLSGATVDIGQHGLGDQRGARDQAGRDGQGRSALAGAGAGGGFRGGGRASTGTRRRSSSGSLDVEL